MGLSEHAPHLLFISRRVTSDLDFRIYPYLAGDFNCTGLERSLSECRFGNRTSLGNCTTDHDAGVLCYNEDGKLYTDTKHIRGAMRAKISSAFRSKKKVYLASNQRSRPAPCISAGSNINNYPILCSSANITGSTQLPLNSSL